MRQNTNRHSYKREQTLVRCDINRKDIKQNQELVLGPEKKVTKGLSFKMLTVHPPPPVVMSQKTSSGSEPAGYMV